MRDMREKVIKRSVSESIDYLIKKALKIRETAPTLSRRYVRMALQLAKKNRVRVASLQKLNFCKKCHVVWDINETLTVSFDRKNNFFVLKCICGFSRKTKP